MTIPARPARTVAGAMLFTVLALLLGGPRALAAPAAQPSSQSTSQPASAPVKYYVVAQSYHGQPEFLFEIAQRYLGSGDRALEIFNLNRGHLEPGGLRVERPEAIRPGWVLQLPADAAGEGVHFGPLPAVPVAPDGSAGSGGSVPGAASAPPSQAPGAAPAASPVAAGSGGGLGGAVPIGWIVLGAAVLAVAAAGAWAWRAGRLAALNLNVNLSRLRRGRAAAPVHPDSSASWTIDRSLRALATACARQRRSMPGVYAVAVAGEQIRLRLTEPDELPPQGWSAEQDGRTWVAALRGLEYAPVEDGPADPYPRLVTLGTTSDGRVLLNLAEAHGLIALQGDAAMQRRLAEEWAHELTANPWSRGVTVLRVGLGAADATTAGALGVPDVGQLWQHLAEDAGGGVVLVRAPGGRDVEQLAELAARPGGQEWTVVVLGGAKQARWRFTVRPDGWLDTGFLPEPVRTGLDAGQPRPAAV